MIAPATLPTIAAPAPGLAQFLQAVGGFRELATIEDRMRAMQVVCRLLIQSRTTTHGSRGSKLKLNEFNSAQTIGMRDFNLTGHQVRVCSARALEELDALAVARKRKAETAAA